MNHTLRKKQFTKAKQKQSFFHDWRLEGAVYGHLTAQHPTIHFIAHRSFMSNRSYCFERNETIIAKFLGRCRQKKNCLESDLNLEKEDILLLSGINF